MHGRTLTRTSEPTRSKRVKGTIIDLGEFATLGNTQDDEPISVLILKCLEQGMDVHPERLQVQIISKIGLPLRHRDEKAVHPIKAEKTVRLTSPGRTTPLRKAC